MDYLTLLGPLFLISNPINEAALIVADVQGSIRSNSQTHGSALDIIIEELGEASSKVFNRSSHHTILQVNAHNLVASGYAAIPRAMKGNEEIALVLRRECRTGVEGQPQRRGVGLHLQDGCADALTSTGRTEIGIDDVACVTARPTVVG